MILTLQMIVAECPSPSTIWHNRLLCAYFWLLKLNLNYSEICIYPLTTVNKDRETCHGRWRFNDTLHWLGMVLPAEGGWGGGAQARSR